MRYEECVNICFKRHLNPASGAVGEAPLLGNRTCGCAKQQPKRHTVPASWVVSGTPYDGWTAP
eukprot:7708277-Pyramimonas_sp.AAC.1